MKFKLFIFTALIPLISVGSALSADNTVFGRWWNPYGPKEDALTFSMFYGHYFYGRDQSLLDASDSYQKTLHFGMRAGWAFTRHWESELSFGFSPSKTALSPEDVYTYDTNVLYQFIPFDYLVPYLTFGLGGITYDPDISADFSRFAINYGGGVKFFVLKNLALRVEVKGLTSFDAVDTALLPSLTVTYYAKLQGEKDELAQEMAEMHKYSGVIEGIHFDVDSSVITKDSFSVLDRAAAYFRLHQDLRLEIQGHSDDMGSVSLNERLSADRAEAVSQYLQKKGVSKGRIEAKGYGFARPIADNSTPEGKQKNRRIEFKILNPKAPRG